MRSSTPLHMRSTCVLASSRGSLRVEISDDGVGGAQIRPSGGLSGLRDRVEDAGGTFEVVSRSGRGTRVKVAIPLER